MTRIFFSAGETSGDIHGGNLVRALKSLAPDVTCEGLGGRRMEAAGMELRYDLAGRAIMGFTEIVQSFGFIRRLFHDTVAHLRRTKPDCLVTIDYPGFNIRLAKEAKRLGIPVVYYISPQVWAWKKQRIHTLARVVRKMLVILPFEERLYRDIGVDCHYVGHPLVDHLSAETPSEELRGSSIVGLLPGSREQEIRRIFPVALEVAKKIAATHPDARFVVPCVDEAREAQVRALAGDFPIATRIGRTCDVLNAARFAVVASGTATLEAAWFNTPMVIVYKVSPASYRLARMLVDIRWIGLVNILSGRGIVPEFIQHEATAERIAPVALALMDDTPERQAMIDDLREVRRILGDGGASRKAAGHVLEVAGGGTDG